MCWRDRSRSCNRRQKKDVALGNQTVNVLNVSYDRIYKNDDFFTKQKVLGQFIIVDSGCPRSLMGDKEYEMLRRNFRTEEKEIKRNESLGLGHLEFMNQNLKPNFP